MLFREENSVHSILNCFRGTAGTIRDYRTTACLRFNRDHSEIFTRGENQSALQSDRDGAILRSLPTRAHRCCVLPSAAAAGTPGPLPAMTSGVARCVEA